MHLQFSPTAENEVRAEWECTEHYGGYPGIIHGGIVATLLDSAMTNCLMLRGVLAYTAELNVRYRAHLRATGRAIVSARVKRVRAPLIVLTSEVVQDGGVVAAATGKFMIASATPD